MSRLISKSLQTAPASTSRYASWINLIAAIVLLILSGTTNPAAAADADASMSAFSIKGVTEGVTGVFVRFAHGTLRIEPCGTGIVRVSFFHGSRVLDLSNPVIPSRICKPSHPSLSQTEESLVIRSNGLIVLVNLASGAISFEDTQRHVLLAESQLPYPRRLYRAYLNGRPVQRAAVWFALPPGEAIYGLGQHQTGLLNERNLKFILSQNNTNISIPFWLSSKGYGVLWNNTSVTEWNNRFQPVLTVQSRVAKAIDYFFIVGPSFDKIIAGYRHLTGQAPLMPRWAYGFWQSKYRYASQKELLGVAAKYRRLGIPLDNIVLDAGWETTLGSRVFNSAFPDPAQMVRALHAEHVHLMVSCWPFFHQGSATFKQLLRHDGFIRLGDFNIPPDSVGSRVYDAFSPSARQIYWHQIKKSLYDIGVDAFWLDVTEPMATNGEAHGPMLADASTAMGNGSRVANLYPFMATKAIYDGQRRAGNKRVFLLTRSSFLGVQRHAAAAWSGDVEPDFSTLKREIPAGLNYSMTGLPYWTTDIGGFLGGDPNDPTYRKVFVRWFEYGAFCPIFRVHGYRSDNQNELWSYGRQAQAILTRYDRLRYRLMPYIYSIAARTTFDSYTPMRALVFDFPTDPKVLDIGNEFLFGPSILVAPVTSTASSREVYLPKPADWYDFWTGERFRGGQSIKRNTPLGIMPLYVRAGSILPMGGDEEYTDQHPDQAIDLRIYPGASADITLYNDDGVTYDYEKGQYSRISIRWNNRARTLMIGTREGSFPGMPLRRTFHVILIGPNHGVGETVATPDRTVEYSGASMRIAFTSLHGPLLHAPRQR